MAGVFWAFASEGLPVRGLDVVVDGDVPIGAGLSSSAALELATARALAAATGTPWDPVRMAKLGQKAENKYVGMNCGIMDQFASAACREGHALLLDCRSLETRPVPVPAGAAVVVMDTGARRSLAGSAYNDRRAACERVVAEIAKRPRACGRSATSRRTSSRRRGRASTPPTSSARATSSPRTDGRSRPRTRSRRATWPGPDG